jgi:hypothetical protein
MASTARLKKEWSKLKETLPSYIALMTKEFSTKEWVLCVRPPPESRLLVVDDDGLIVDRDH